MKSEDAQPNAERVSPTDLPRVSAGEQELRGLTLVLSAPRSGSTLLCRDIASLGGLGLPREYFRDLDRAPVGSAGEMELFSRVALGVQQDATTVGAVKLMVPQARAVAEAIGGQRVDTPAEAMSVVVNWAASRFDRVLLVILVRNAVDQAISRAVAQATGIFHSTDPAFAARGAALLDVPSMNERILDELPGVLRNRKALQLVAADHSEFALTLTYEDLVNDTSRTTQRLISKARESGFDPRRNVVTRRMTKVISTAQGEKLRTSFLAFLGNETGEFSG